MNESATHSDAVTWHHAGPHFRASGSAFNVIVVGCGGNGTRMLLHLTRLQRALSELDGPRLKVLVYDGDTVSRPNLARQPFHAADLGQPKATTLVSRINLSYGTDFEAVPKPFSRETAASSAPHLLISCVDTRSARKEIDALLAEATGPARGRTGYLLDLGNEAQTGQVVLGTFGGEPDVPLPTCAQLYPETIDAELDGEGGPSCSTAEALRRQDLFTNDAVAVQAANLVWRLFRHGRIRHHGAFCNLESGQVTPIPVPSPTAKEDLSDE